MRQGEWVRRANRIYISDDTHWLDYGLAMPLSREVALATGDTLAICKGGTLINTETPEMVAKGRKNSHHLDVAAFGSSVRLT